MYDTYLPAGACEFPNDNPELHQGVRWVCSNTQGAPRAVLRSGPFLSAAAPPAPLSTPFVEAPVMEASAAGVEAVAAQADAAPTDAAPASAAQADPAAPAALAARETAAAAAVARALRCAGPLTLDLSRIVLPHRVADVPPPPEFIFRPFEPARAAPSLPPAAAASVANALPLLGYRVVDALAAQRRVQRGWRVDIAPCLQLERLDAPLAAVLAAPAADVDLAAAVLDTFEPLPPAPLLPAPSSDETPSSSKKRQRRRAARVASSASLMAAAQPGNSELARALAELDAEFTERRVEQPPAARNRQARRAKAGRSASAKRAANAV